MSWPSAASRPTLAAAGLLALLAALTAPASAQADVFVDFETGTNSGTCGDTMATPCMTVLQGVANASAGETVRVDDTPGDADSSIGFSLDMGKSLIAQEFGPHGDENALPEPDTIIDAGNDVGFVNPAIRVPAPGGGTISGFVIRSRAFPVELDASTTLTGNLIDEEAGLGDCMIEVANAGNASNIANNDIVDPDPVNVPRAGVCITDSAAPSVNSNAFADLTHGVQSGGGNTTISSNTFTGIRGSTSFAAIEVTAGTPTVTANLIQNPGDAFAIGIGLQQTAAMVGATLRRNSVIGYRVGLVANNTEGVVDLNGDLIAKSTNVGLAMNDTDNDNDANLAATNVTVTDSGSAEVIPTNSDLVLNSSIIGAAGITASAPATCAISFSRGPAIAPGGTGCSNFQTTAAPGFVNVAVNNYRLGAGSPLIDSGDPAAPLPGILDLDGQARVTDGNGDGIARRDIGADETATLVLPPPPPSTSPTPLQSGAPAATGPPATRKCKKKRKKGKKRAAPSAKRKGCKKKKRKK